MHRDAAGSTDLPASHPAGSHPRLEITLVERFGVPVVAVALNLAEVAAGESHRVVAHCQADSGNRPVVDPVNDGVGAIAEAVAHLVPDRTR